MRSLILLALFLTGCVTTEVTPEKLAKHYESAVFAKDGKIWKLSGPIDYRITYDRRDDYDLWEALIRRHLDEMEEPAGVVFQKDGKTSNGLVWIHLSNSETSNTNQGDASCAVRPKVELENEDRHVIKLTIAAQRNPRWIRRCIPHEIAHVLQFWDHSTHIAPSIFYPYHNYNQSEELQWYDIALLKIHSDYRIKLGMTREEIKPIVREIIEDRWDEFRKDVTGRPAAANLKP